MYIDTHAHINDERLLQRAEEIYGNMQKDNLGLIINASSSIEMSVISNRLAKQYKNVYSMVGIHPEDVDSYQAGDIQVLNKLAQEEKVVAIGEVGLDYHYEGFNKQKQYEVFLAQVKLANERKLPLVVHLRDAYDDFADFIQTHKPLLQGKVLMHCYAGSGEYAQMLLKELPQVYFSFGGVLTFKNGKNIREAFITVPKNRIFAETDCPYLTPEPFRGRMLNEPKLVQYVYREMSSLWQQTPALTEEQIEKNIKEFFHGLIQF